MARQRVGGCSIVLVGLMGAGKTSIGRRLAEKLDLPFIDADVEIEKAAGKSIPDIFADHGEAHFRDGERKVIARLLENGKQVLATGGGAFINPETRERIKQHSVSIWLKADLDLLMKRVLKRGGRPLLETGDPEAVMRDLMDKRYPVYAEADITVKSQDVQHNQMVNDVIRALAHWNNGEALLHLPDDSAVRVNLGNRSYDIEIGDNLLAHAGTKLKGFLARPFTTIVTDSHVAEHHLKTLQDSLSAEGITHQSIILKPGEATKSYAGLAETCDKLLASGIERNDSIIAFGGGVIGDLAGFAASILRRGVKFIQIPTTLLAQVDSSVGGKTGINSPHGKNLIGSFHQPQHVLIDLGLLKTLPRRERAAGYAEVVKYGLLGDAAFYHWLDENAEAVLECHMAELEHAVRVSCETKARIVTEDETETGVRALLNFGHTFGHALEKATGYSDILLHGEAVSIGMVQAFRFSEHLQLCPVGTADQIEKHLSRAGLPTHTSHLNTILPPPEALLETMRQDKKASGGKLTFILTRGIGEAFVARDVRDADVLLFLQKDQLSS